jgi:hypothetical protein
MEEDAIINNDFLIDPRAGAGISGIATSAEPLLAQGSRLADIQEVEPGAFVDRSSVTSLNDLFNYYYGGMSSQQPVEETPAVEAGAVVTPAVDTGSQDQATGDLGLDTTFQDAGATDVPGTIGTLGSLTEPTTQIAPTVNLLDEFGIAGDVYADVPPTTINVPALDLSGTSEELIDQGVIETPQEFYGRTYDTSPSEYDLLDQEEQNLVDQQYGTAYGLSPAVEPAPTLRDVPLLGVQAAFALKDAYDDATAPSLSETIDFDTYADPGIDAEENQLTAGTNLQTTDTLDITEDPIPEIEPYADPDEITAGLTFETPAEQIIDQGDSGRDTDVQQSGTTSSGEGRDTDVQQSGTAPDFSGYDSGGYDPAPSPVNDPTDRGGGGGGGGGGKIVCTMMNETYGFGSFRNKIWLRQSKDLAPEYQKGYHKMFLPLVKLSKTNIVIRKILEHIAVHRTIDIRQEARGKTHILGRVYRKVLEPICYLVGKYAKR